MVSVDWQSCSDWVLRIAKPLVLRAERIEGSVELLTCTVGVTKLGLDAPDCWVPVETCHHVGGLKTPAKDRYFYLNIILYFTL